MKNEYIIQKENYKVKIVTEFLQGYSNDGTFVIRDVCILPARKRNWRSITNEAKNTMDYYYAKKNNTQNEVFMKQFLQYCTEDDLRDAIMFHYETMKPDTSVINIHVL